MPPNSPELNALVTRFRESYSSEKLRVKKTEETRWADAQRDGRPSEYRWRPLLNAAKIG